MVTLDVMPTTSRTKKSFTWKLPGVDETPRGLLGGGERRPPGVPAKPPILAPVAGGEGVLMLELLGSRKFGLLTLTKMENYLVSFFRWNFIFSVLLHFRAMCAHRKRYLASGIRSLFIRKGSNHAYHSTTTNVPLSLQLDYLQNHLRYQTEFFGISTILNYL